MINFHGVTKEHIKEHKSNWPQIFDHSYRILIIGGSGSGNRYLADNSDEDKKRKSHKNVCDKKNT